MDIERHELTLTTDSSGDATGDTGQVTGRVLQVRYVPHATTPLDTNADLTITGEASGVNLDEHTWAMEAGPGARARQHACIRLAIDRIAEGR
jgi:hypothetical protein